MTTTQQRQPELNVDLTQLVAELAHRIQRAELEAAQWKTAAHTAAAERDQLATQLANQPDPDTDNNSPA